MERTSGNSLSTAMPVWTNLTSAETQGAELSTSTLIFTDLHSRTSVASRTTDDQFQMKSSEIPVHTANIKTDTSTSSSDDLSLTTHHSQSDSVVEMSVKYTSTSSSESATLTIRHLESDSLAEMSLKDTTTSSSDDLTLTTHHLPSVSDSIVEMSLKESETSSAQNVRVVSRSMLETTVKTETEDSARLMNSTEIATAVPLRGDQIMHTLQPQDVSQTHISEDTQKTSVLRDATVRTDTGHVSSSYKTTLSLQFSKAPQSSVTSTLQKSSAAEMTQTDTSLSRSSSSRLQFTAIHETTSQSSVASGIGLIDEYASAVNHSGFHMNGTSDAMKAADNGDNSVAVTAAVSVGIVMGIFTTFIIAVSLIVILRRRRKTDNLQTSYACVHEEKSILPSKVCLVGTHYTEVAQSPSRPGSVHKADEVFLLPHEQAVHKTSVDSDVMYSDGDGSFEELDHLVHIDTDMSSLLQVMDSQLVQNSHRSSTSDDPSGSSSVDTVPIGQNSAAVSENQCRRPDLLCCSDGKLYHEYDPVYVPHNDAAAMARRVDNETSYVRTLQSRPNFSPYEEVCYGVRPLLLTDHPQTQDRRQPAVPPRTSSVADSRLQNSGSNRMVVEHVDGGQTDETDPHGELSHRTSTVSDVDVADTPYESIVINPVG